MTIRKDGPDARDGVLGPDGRFTREWFLFLKDDGWKESSQQTITVATVTTVAHGFSTTPSQIAAYLVCTTAELGYAVDDRVPAFAYEDTTDYGIQPIVNGTNVGFVVGADGVRILDRTGGSVGTFATITPANWRVILRVKA